MKKIQIRGKYKFKELLFNKILDLLIVIFGITIAFQLNNLKENSDHRTLEKFYLENLNRNINNDISNIKNISDKLKYDLMLTNKCISQYTNKNVSIDTLGKAVVNILSFETFDSRNDNTYTTLINSSGLNIIEDTEIRNLITEYYKNYKSIDRFESVYTEFLLNHFNPYFSSIVNYKTGKVNKTSNIKDSQVINNLVIVQDQLNDGIYKYNLALYKAQALKKELTKKLN